jgi:hypothetical protein
LVGWLVELEASIRSSNCYSEYYSIWVYRLGRALIGALITFVRQEGPSEQVVDACKKCLVATFEKIWGTSLTTNAPEIKNTEQQQLESLQRFEDASRLLWDWDFASLVKETSVFDPNEIKLIMSRTAELLNFSPQNTNLGEQRLKNQEGFFRLVAGKIFPYMMGRKEIFWVDEYRNYPNALEEYLRQLNPDRPLIENFLAVLAQEDWIDRLYDAIPI